MLSGAHEGVSAAAVAAAVAANEENLWDEGLEDSL
jgi:hypothetical protein